MDKHPECPNHPGIYLTCDNTSQGLRWKCTIHGCTVVGWGDLECYTPADYETRQARRQAVALVADHFLDVPAALRKEFGVQQIGLCDKQTCEKIIEWAKQLCSTNGK